MKILNLFFQFMLLNSIWSLASAVPLPLSFYEEGKIGSHLHHLEKRQCCCAVAAGIPVAIGVAAAATVAVGGAIALTHYIRKKIKKHREEKKQRELMQQQTAMNQVNGTYSPMPPSVSPPYTVFGSSQTPYSNFGLPQPIPISTPYSSAAASKNVFITENINNFYPGYGQQTYQNTQTGPFMPQYPGAVGNFPAAPVLPQNPQPGVSMTSYPGVSNSFNPTVNIGISNMNIGFPQIPTQPTQPVTSSPSPTGLAGINEISNSNQQSAHLGPMMPSFSITPPNLSSNTNGDQQMSCETEDIVLPYSNGISFSNELKNNNFVAPPNPSDIPTNSGNQQMSCETEDTVLPYSGGITFPNSNVVSIGNQQSINKLQATSMVKPYYGSQASSFFQAGTMNGWASPASSYIGRAASSSSSQYSSSNNLYNNVYSSNAGNYHGYYFGQQQNQAYST